LALAVALALAAAVAAPEPAVAPGPAPTVEPAVAALLEQYMGELDQIGSGGAAELEATAGSMTEAELFNSRMVEELAKMGVSERLLESSFKVLSVNRQAEQTILGVEVRTEITYGDRPGDYPHGHAADDHEITISSDGGEPVVLQDHIIEYPAPKPDPFAPKTDLGEPSYFQPPGAAWPFRVISQGHMFTKESACVRQWLD
jgi:hypothetical protein